MLKVTRAGYYLWKTREVSARELRDCELSEHIKRIHEDSRGVYGAPRVLAQLKREGIHTSQRRVARLMRQAGIKGVCRARKHRGLKVKPERNPAEDLVKRNFSANYPNRLWFADITYVKTYQGWLYLAVVFDIYSRMIVGWSMSNTMEAVLVDDALKMAIARRNPPAGLVHHSDHGGQYHSLLLGRTMRKFKIIPSMGAISAPWDNAVTESLMSTIKMECVHRTTFETKDDARIEIFDYIERFYNRLRLHSSLGYLSPAEFEAKMLEEAVSA